MVGELLAIESRLQIELKDEKRQAIRTKISRCCRWFMELLTIEKKQNKKD